MWPHKSFEVAAGGVAGYAAKRSVPSLVAGGTSGLALIACGQTGRHKAAAAISDSWIMMCDFCCGIDNEPGTCNAKISFVYDVLVAYFVSTYLQFCSTTVRPS